MKFRDLKIGDSFDFLGPESMYHSFYLRCTKTSQRKYRDENGENYTVGSINADVFHVND